MICERTKELSEDRHVVDYLSIQTVVAVGVPKTRSEVEWHRAVSIIPCAKVQKEHLHPDRGYLRRFRTNERTHRLSIQADGTAPMR